jgi:hypothetical protein
MNTKYPAAILLPGFHTVKPPIADRPFALDNRFYPRLRFSFHVRPMRLCHTLVDENG